MKKIKLLPSIIMLALCIGILGIGIYAANPTNNVITGTITVNAANAGVTIQVFKGTDTSVDPIDSKTGRATTLIELTGENAIKIDASEAENLSQVQAAVYTIRLSTTSNIKLVVDTETIEWRDGTTATGTITDALKITKVHTPAATDTSTGLAYFNNAAGVYDIVCSINLTDLYEEDFTSELDLVINVYKLDDWVEDGNTGINGIDYLHLGEYPQTRVATSVDGYTETEDTFKAYNDAAEKTSLIETTRKIYTKDGERFVYLDSVWNQDNYMSESATNLYRIEPLKWRILSNTNGELKLMCDTIIEQVYYQQFYEETNGSCYAKIDGVTSDTIYANNYYYSTLRRFMNEMFLSSAFSTAEQNIILENLVDNSDASMGGIDDNNYSCQDTTDKIFALSYVEANALGSDEALSATSSDYAIDTGILTDWWWLRSPMPTEAIGVYCVTGGGVTEYMANSSYYGCVPALLLGL